MPELTCASLSPDKSYIVICVDLDAPFPSFPVLGPILHWIQPGLKAAPIDGGRGDRFRLEAAADEPFIANWAPPGPPSVSGPHRYVFLLHEQPDGFDGGKGLAPPGGKEMGLGARVRFDVDKWVRESNLGPAVAVNYFSSK